MRLIFVIIAIGFIYLIFQHFGTKQYNCHEIVSIGGCNQYRCGVVLDNGERTSVGAPTIGQNVCNNSFVWE